MARSYEKEAEDLTRRLQRLDGQAFPESDEKNRNEKLEMQKTIDALQAKIKELEKPCDAKTEGQKYLKLKGGYPNATLKNGVELLVISFNIAKEDPQHVAKMMEQYANKDKSCHKCSHAK